MDNLLLNSFKLTIPPRLSGSEFQYLAAEYVNECRPSCVVVDGFGSERTFVPLGEYVDDLSLNKHIFQIGRIVTEVETFENTQHHVLNSRISKSCCTLLTGLKEYHIQSPSSP